MSHLYLHIPFCRQACHYCDFHFSTTQHGRTELVRAMMAEIELRKDELPVPTLNTVYFGGGTPSLLTETELKSLFDSIRSHWNISPDAEITLEANPDDLNAMKIRELKNAGINRLSIGIQSFRDEDLQLMNRAHSAREAEESVLRSQDAGISNITIDLIYGIPGLSLEAWEKNLQKAFQLNVPHLSSYSLTYEPRTAFFHQLKKGALRAESDEMYEEQFRKLIALSSEAGLEQYEISNFAKEGFEAVHNSSYWKGRSYLGIGPSAHSFNGTHRRWNISNNAVYTRNLLQNITAFEEEILSPKDRFNEMIMLGLRAKWGVNTEDVKRTFGEKVSSDLMKNARTWLETGELILKDNVLLLGSKGKFIADRIASDLFLTEE